MMAAPVLTARHGADDASVAVEERHRHDDLVLLGVVESLREKLELQARVYRRTDTIAHARELGDI